MRTTIRGGNTDRGHDGFSLGYSYRMILKREDVKKDTLN